MKNLIVDCFYGIALLLGLVSILPHIKMRYHKDGSSTPWPFHQRLRNALKGVWIPLVMLALLLIPVVAVLFVIGLVKNDPDYTLKTLQKEWWLGAVILASTAFTQISGYLEADAADSESFEQLAIRRLSAIERKLWGTVVVEDGDWDMD